MGLLAVTWGYRFDKYLIGYGATCHDKGLQISEIPNWL